MHLWRLSGAEFAERFDGGYGYACDGRWNSRGNPVTYCSTGTALCVLEKLVHIEDASLLPDDTMLVRYDVPDDVEFDVTRLGDLPPEWRAVTRITRSRGDNWLRAESSCLMSVPSAVVPVAETADRNIMINHRHQDASRIAISRIERFDYDPRLFAHG